MDDIVDRLLARATATTESPMASAMEKTLEWQAAAEIASLRAELAASQAALSEELEARKRTDDDNKRLRTALATARNDALEEAAKECSRYGFHWASAAIRALKDGRAMPEPPKE